MFGLFIFVRIVVVFAGGLVIFICYYFCWFWGGGNFVGVGMFTYLGLKLVCIVLIGRYDVLNKVLVFFLGFV